MMRYGLSRAGLAALCCGLLASPVVAGDAVLSGTYGWEDGVGTVLGTSGNIVDPTNVGFPEPVNSGKRALRVTNQNHVGTPQVWVAFIENLEHGDVVEAKVFGYDEVPGGNPSLRIWAHYAISGDVFSNAGSAGGNNTPTNGFGWEEISHTWTFDSAGGTRDALVIEVRLYSTPTDCTECSTDYYIDDVTVNVICGSNPNLSITFPDWSMVTGPSKPGKNCIPPEPCGKPNFVASYGWEDGTGTIMGKVGNVANPTNVTSPEPVNSGNRALRVTHAPHGGATPQAWLAFIENLEDGDEITASFFGLDEEPGVPRMRIWAHYAVTGNINSIAQAGGNETYSAGIGWEEISHTWTFDSNFGQRNALVIQARLYSDNNCTECTTDYYIDDVTVSVCSNNPNVTISFPDTIIIPKPTDPCNPGLGEPDLAGTFGWEDGKSTILGSFGNISEAVNVTHPDPVHQGKRALRVTEAPHSGTPQAYIAYIENLQHGDVIVGRFHGYDTTPGSDPRLRIWGHYADSGDVMSFRGSAGGNEDGTTGIGWEEICMTWVFDEGNPPRDALVIEARVYSTPATCPTCSTDFFIDSASVDVYSSNPNVTITFPDWVVIGNPTKKCPADFNNDGTVDVLDLLALLGAWGSADPQIDLNGSGNVDVQDLLILLGSWGACP
ncbi:MAG TPA: GC-type dockerin domain-anchored protein [Phycisphaerales bacterium]|nr:GC-type dockerin domain-anchored protein [Phycisphaerales bacterium]